MCAQINKIPRISSSEDWLATNTEYVYWMYIESTFILFNPVVE